MYNEQIAARRSKSSGKGINLHRSTPPGGIRRSFCRFAAVCPFNEAEFNFLSGHFINILPVTDPHLLESHQIMKKISGMTNLSLFFFSDRFLEAFLGDPSLVIE